MRWMRFSLDFTVSTILPDHVANNGCSQMILAHIMKSFIESGDDYSPAKLEVSLLKDVKTTY